MIPLDTKALRAAFGSYPTGVTVVTSTDSSGAPVGFTANSFTSVSMDPPLLLVCPARSLSSFELFETCQRFAVNVLSEGQEDISNIFAGYKGDRFSQVDWSPDHGGMPLLNNAAAQFSCVTTQVIPAGDHIVLVGEIDGFNHTDFRGLGYASGQYFSLGLERAAVELPPPGRSAHVGAIVVRNDMVLLDETPNGFDLPRIEITEPAPVREALSSWFDKHRVKISLGKAYSIFDDNIAGHFTYFLAKTSSSNTPDGCRFIDINDLTEQSYASPTCAALLERFAIEFQTQSFGLYVGDSTSGDLHTIQPGS